jgi:hypothetical protein
MKALRFCRRGSVLVVAAVVTALAGLPGAPAAGSGGGSTTTVTVPASGFPGAAVALVAGRYELSATGTWNIGGPYHTSGPFGARSTTTEGCALVPSAPMSALVAKVGSGSWFRVGGGPHIIDLDASATLELAANDCSGYHGDNTGSLVVTIASAPSGTVCFDGSTLDGWTFPLSTPTVNGASGNPAPAFQTTSGRRAWREFTGLGPGWEITADMLVLSGGPVNLGLLADPAGAGQFFRLDTRPGAPEGFAAMTSWTRWNAPPDAINDPNLRNDRWNAVRIVIGDTAAVGYIDGTEIHTYTYAQRGVVVALHGDSAGGGRFDNICVRPPGGLPPVTVVVTPPTQTITYGAPLDLTPTYEGFEAEDDWDTEPTCKVYESGATVFDDTSEVTDDPVPVGTYTISCSGGTLPDGYTADYDTTTTLTVNTAAATLAYTGTSGATSLTSITLSASLSPVACSSEGIVYTVNGVVVDDPSVAYPVTEGQLYEIEVSYSDPNCDAAPVYAIVLAGDTSAGSNGGGQYKVAGAGVINFGYTVQVNNSKNGPTQVSGQILWNSQNGKFRYKGAITGFVNTTTDCATGTVCGQIIGNGTLRTRNDAGEWIIAGSNLSSKGFVVDATTATTCTSGKKPTCTTVTKPDFFGIDILGSNLTGEQESTVSGWPTPVQLSGGNLVIK